MGLSSNGLRLPSALVMASPKAFPFTWSPTWFRPQESVWSLSYKLSVANLTPTKRIQDELLWPLRRTPLGWLVTEKRRGAKWLAELLGVPEALAETAFLNDLVVLGVDDLLLSRHLRHCPECLKHHFHSPLYQFLLLDTCPIHNVPLQEGCPHCSTSLAGHPLDVSPDARCLHCGNGLIEQPADWLEVVQAETDVRPLIARRQQLCKRLNKGYIEGALSQYQRKGKTNGTVETLRSYLADDDTHRLEMNEFMVRELETSRLSAEEFWTALDACRNALYNVYAQLPDRHADAFKRDYAPGFIERQLALPMGNKAVAAYRLAEEFLGVLAPPANRGDVPEISQRRFNKSFFEDHLDTSDHVQRLPISTGIAMAPLIVQSLYVDALEYLVAGKPGRPWTLWALEPDSFKYPVRWFGITTGKPTFKYQIKVVTQATKRRLQEILATI